MKQTTEYAGIDYSLGQSNVDTGIHFGVISQNSIMPEALDDFHNQAKDLTFEAFQQEVKDKLREALSDYFSDHKWSNEKQSKLNIAVEDAFEVLECDLNEQYQAENPSLEYSKNELVIVTCLDNDLIVLKSPFFTFAQFCSPCVPGAGNLDCPCESGPKTYCLGHDWFDGGKAPYPVYSVETWEEVKGE